MRSTSWLGRACAVALATTAVVAALPARAQPALIPALQIDGRGFGHGVGMAQDGALAMGQAGATLQQILAQFYPGTALARAGGGVVRVPVYAGNNIELVFPEGGEVRGNSGTLAVAPGGAVIVSREGNATRVRPVSASQPPPSPAPTTTTSSPEPTTTTGAPTTTSTTALFPMGQRSEADEPTPPLTPTTTAPPPTATTTTAPPSNPGLLFSGTATADPNGDGRVGLSPRNRRYRGVMELSPLAGSGGVRFVNEVAVETYLRGMGEVRNPSWPAASLQAQAVAARTYALRAMSAGGELCDTQRCQVYIGSDAEYAAMDRAVAATAGQVLTYNKSLASAVYSANGGGHSASREEGFGLAGPSSYPYLRAAPYLCPKPDVWSVTVALRDVGRRLNYKGELTAVEIAERGPSGRATRLVLRGSAGDATVTGLAFDAALGLKSTLFSLKTTMAAAVADIEGGSVLQAPPEEAAALATGYAPPTTLPPADVATPVAARAAGAPARLGGFGAVAITLWVGVVALALVVRRRVRFPWHAELS